MSTVVQGAWAVMLGQLTGRHDVIFGTTLSGRPPEIADVESMVGLFVNSLPVRVEYAPGLPRTAPWPPCPSRPPPASRRQPTGR